MPSKDRWGLRHLSMLGEGKDRARPIDEGQPRREVSRQGRWTRPIALAIAAVSAVVGLWLIVGPGVAIGGVLVLAFGVGGGLYAAATTRP